MDESDNSNSPIDGGENKNTDNGSETAENSFESATSNVSEAINQQDDNNTKPLKPSGTSTKKYLGLGLGLLIAVVVSLGFIFSGSLTSNQDQDSNKSENMTSPQPVDKLTVGLAAGTPTSIYPNIGTGAVELNLNLQIFEGLVRYEDGNRLVPQIATSWVNPDENTWEFDIKQGVKFHNGSDLTVDDVIFSIDYFKGNADFVGEIYTSTIDKVEKVDDDTIRIVTKNPDPVLLNKLAFALMIDDASEGDPHPDNGTGPYTLKPETNFDENGIELVPFTDWHNGQVGGVQHLIFKVYSDEEQLASDLENGLIDILDGSLPSDTETYGQYTYDPLILPTPKVNLLGMNHILEGSPTKQLKFRQAVYYAIDVDKVIEAYDIEGGAPAGQFVPREIPGFNPNIERYEYSPEKARELLKEIDWDSENDSLEFTYFFVAKEAAKNIAEQLEDVGIKVILDEQTDGPTIGAKVFGGEAQMWFIGESSNLYDASDVLSAQFESAAYYNNEAVNAKLDEANSINEASSRITALQEVAQLLADDVASIPLYTSTSTWHIRSDRNYSYEIDWTSELGVYFAELYQEVN